MSTVDTKNGQRFIGNEEAFFGIVHNAFQMRAELLNSLMNPQRNLYEECHYPISLGIEDYTKSFNRDGIGARVVKIYPNGAWRKKVQIYESEEGEQTPFDDAFEALDARVNLLHYMQRVNILSRIGQYGCMFLGFDDAKTPEDLAKPVSGVLDEGIEFSGLRKMRLGRDDKAASAKLRKTAKTAPESKLDAPKTTFTPARRLLYVRAFDQSLLKIKEYETSTASPRFGMPKVYSIKFSDFGASGNSVSQTDTMERDVHWSRVIHVADNKTTSEVFGQPSQECCWNYISNCCKILGASGEGYYKGGFPGLALESMTTPDGVPMEFDIEKTRKQVFDYMNGLQRYLALMGMTAKTLAPALADPEKHFAIQIEGICIAIDCPKRIFMGSERGELASSQDLRDWNDSLMAYQDDFVSPIIVRATVDRLIMAGVLPMPADGYIDYWPDLNSATPQIQADIALKITQALVAYISSGVSVLIAPFEFLTEVVGLDANVAEAILDAAEDELEENEEKGLGLPEPPMPPVDGEVPPANDDAPPTKKTTKATKKAPKKKAAPVGAPANA